MVEVLVEPMSSRTMSMTPPFEPTPLAVRGASEVACIPCAAQFRNTWTSRMEA